jgi:hypothetical protein
MGVIVGTEAKIASSPEKKLSCIKFSTDIRSYPLVLHMVINSFHDNFIKL